MDATTMPSITWLTRKLAAAYPDIRLVPGDAFRWDPRERSVYYTDVPHAAAYLLHEFAHALLSHSEYRSDVELLSLERDAWEYATTTLSNTFSTPIDDSIVQESLDTYRDWLHARSTCPTCSATGIQHSRRQYRCLGCLASWEVNEARTCRLRRVTT